MDLLRIAAFCDGDTGGNPAGVALCPKMPETALMQRTAAEVAYSETAFAAPFGRGWRVRYFSPQSEVPFCGHATIALGAALAMQHGNNVFELELNHDSITVEGTSEGNVLAAALQSPHTSSQAAGDVVVSDALALFGYARSELDPRIPPALAEAGARHLILALNSRSRLADMAYDIGPGQQFMNELGLVTISLVFAETPRSFHSRNAFASGGVYEDPATGAAAAALAGYLRDLGWPHGGRLSIVQGQDMGMRSLLNASLSNEPGSSIRVSGYARLM